MRWTSYTVTDAATAHVGRVEEGGVRAILGLEGHAGLSPIRRALLRSGGDLAAFARRGELDPHLTPWDAVRLEPVVPDPGKIVAAPVNYRDHQSEMNQEAHIDALGFFLKSPTSVLAHGGVVRLPYNDRRFDQEGEFAVVIGREASRISRRDALDVVAGYTLLLDMTMRGGEDRSTRKSFDTFTPLGPYMVTPDELPDPSDAILRCWVNDELRQQTRLSSLIWDVAAFISYASSVTRLLPGDILTTGTPAGIGQVGDGDRICVEVAELGRLEVGVSDAGAVACPTKGAGRGPKPPEAVTPVVAV